MSSSSGYSSLYTSTVQPGTTGLPLPKQHSHPILVFKTPALLPSTSYLFPLHLPFPACFWLFCYTSCFSSSPASLRVLQSIAGGFQARSTELLHFISSHPVGFICIQESNLNSSSSFWIHGFSALRSDRTHSRSGILFPDDRNASDDVIFFVRHDLSFSELPTALLPSLDLYSNYVGVQHLTKQLLFGLFP